MHRHIYILISVITFIQPIWSYCDINVIGFTTAAPREFKNCSLYNSENYGTSVCGSDHRTYPNSAFLYCVNDNRGSNVKVVYNGSCDDPCWKSTNEFTPCLEVCGSDGRTYQSKAALECYSLVMLQANITTVPIRMAYIGKCCDVLAPVVSYDTIATITPTNIVCGNDGRNYTNNWSLMAAAQIILGLAMAHPGPCKTVCPYAPLYQPYCGSDKITYANLQALACARQMNPTLDLKPLYMGECCPDPDNPPNPCAFKYGNMGDDCAQPSKPVCASNGVTYPNARAVYCLRYNGAKIRILHYGGCTVDEVKKVASKKCDACDLSFNFPEWNPVCGMNNITYSSPAAMICINPRLTIMYEGECGRPIYACCYSATTKPSNEVCGNDGRTYRNEDALSCAARDDPYLRLKAYGHCGVQNDPCLYRGDPYIADGGTPVCGSDGLTYVTPYALWCARKSCPELKYVHDGMCITDKLHHLNLPTTRLHRFASIRKNNNKQDIISTQQKPSSFHPLNKTIIELLENAEHNVSMKLFLDFEPHNHHVSLSLDHTDNVDDT